MRYLRNSLTVRPSVRPFVRSDSRQTVFADYKYKSMYTLRIRVQEPEYSLKNPLSTLSATLFQLKNLKNSLQ